jgi:hypothetical protein
VIFLPFWGIHYISLNILLLYFCSCNYLKKGEIIYVFQTCPQSVLGLWSLLTILAPQSSVANLLSLVQIKTIFL